MLVQASSMGKAPLKAIVDTEEVERHDHRLGGDRILERKHTLRLVIGWMVFVDHSGWFVTVGARAVLAA